MLEALEGLGLTAYEAKALDHLVRHGDRTGPDLSRETGIPFGRVYDTLNALVERGLVTSKAGRPRVFTAAAPTSIPGRLLATNKRRLQEEERNLGQQAAALATEMGRLSPRKAPGSTLYGVRLGEDASRQFLIEATHEAKRRVDAYLAFDHIQDDDLAIFDAFRQAVARNVKTRILLRRKDVDYLLSTPYVQQVVDALLPHIGDSLQVRLSDTDNLSFSILDDERVMLGVKNPIDPRIYFAVVHMDDRAFAADLSAKFDALWRDGEIDEGLAKKLLGTKGGRTLLKLGAKLRR